MAKTILITGASTGIGRATANLFAKKGCKVAATMRTPEKAEGLDVSDTLKLYALDVLDEASIDAAFSQVEQDFGAIDVVVNNAGYGAFGPLEAATREQIERQYDTNVFGLIAVMQRALPGLRAKGGGVIINVSSMGGRLTLPLYSLYHGTKFAVEGITESMVFEMEPLNIRMKLIEPGAIATDFSSRSRDVLQKEGLTAYDPLIQQFMKAMERVRSESASAEDVAKVIYQAATDEKSQLRYVVGKDAKTLWRMRRIFGADFVMKAVSKRINNAR